MAMNWLIPYPSASCCETGNHPRPYDTRLPGSPTSNRPAASLAMPNASVGGRQNRNTKGQAPPRLGNPVPSAPRHDDEQQGLDH